MKVVSSDPIRQAALSHRVFDFPAKLLRGSSLLWLSTFLLGQLAFFYYLMAFYGVSIAVNDLEMWNVFEQFGVIPYIAGDTIGNFAFGFHALGAGIIAIAGGLQLVPQVRQRFPKFHRYNGRMFLLTCVTLTLSGLYLVWIRNAPPSAFNDLKTTFNGVLILACSYFVLRRVLEGDIKNHSRWAIRLYLVANGQWFLRVGVLCYLALGNLIGEANFGDPFFAFWDYAAFVAPLAVLQLYFYAKDRGGSLVQSITATFLIVLTLLMFIGIAALGALHLKIINGQPLGF
ncbi:MAG TPA: DUF2306 domain-containing protein [Marinagarivorans sp.]